MTDELTALGYFDEARAGLEAKIDELVASRARGRKGLGFDLALLAINHATSDLYESGPTEAADYLAEFSSAVPLDRDFKINVIINRAAYLAEAERYDEALELLIPAYREFREGVDDADHYRISGSDREFAWILACAYAQKGQAGIAASYAGIVTSAAETPQDPYLQQTKRSTAIKLRMYRCMNDPAGYFATWRSAQMPVLSPAWLEFQKRNNFIITSGMPRPWVSTRPEADEIAIDYRQLPESYLPALSRWQTSVGEAR